LRAADQSDDTRARLLKAAIDVFAERGYENSTIREICSRAGANVALIHYHFGDKLELYTEVLRFSMTCGVPAPQPANFSLSDPEHALRNVIGAMVERVLQTSDQADLRYRLMLHEFAQPSTATPRVVQEVMRPMYDRLREIVGAILGLPADHEKTRLSAHSVIGQIAHYARSAPMLRTLWPEMKMTEVQRSQIATHITEFSLAYLRQTGEPLR
jgi:TetR/AcrR family transcriptional regulator, regulator of cefoperazone and chloramphenicol sensitivity